jgi:hypothetical protein
MENTGRIQHGRVATYQIPTKWYSIFYLKTLEILYICLVRGPFRATVMRASIWLNFSLLSYYSTQRNRILQPRVLSVSPHLEHFSKNLKYNQRVMFGKAVAQLRD